MRLVDGRPPEPHCCWPGLSDCLQLTMAAEETCVGYGSCSVSVLFSSSSFFFFLSTVNGFDNWLLFVRLEAAASNPETLSQEAIIDNLDPVEAARLSKVRNIGIAVWTSIFSENKTAPQV